MCACVCVCRHQPTPLHTHSCEEKKVYLSGAVRGQCSLTHCFIALVPIISKSRMHAEPNEPIFPLPCRASFRDNEHHLLNLQIQNLLAGKPWGNVLLGVILRGNATPYIIYEWVVVIHFTWIYYWGIWLQCPLAALFSVIRRIYFIHVNSSMLIFFFSQFGWVLVYFHFSPTMKFENNP